MGIPRERIWQAPVGRELIGSNYTSCGLNIKVGKADAIPPVSFSFETEHARQQCVMKKNNLEAMSVDELWSLHEEITRILSERITSEKRELEKRLAILNRGRDGIERGDANQSYNADGKARRKYPRVFPKYRNPQMPSETWSGRGKQPRWLVAAIQSGRKIDDFRIREAGGAKARAERA